MHQSSLAWGDYDNDGDLDLVLTGWTGSESLSRVYRNDGGNFTDIAAGLIGVEEGSAAWGDYDNDGDLDLMLTGFTGSETISRVYRNDAGTFTDIGAGLPGVAPSSAAWGDYDNDGDLDILLTGFDDDGQVFISRVYRNDAGTFTDIAAGLPGVVESFVAWGDYDNDGDLDILLTGLTGSEKISSVYRNDGGDVFTDLGAGLPGVDDGSVAWGDYDNDGDLDILLTGYTSSEAISRVYRNDAGIFTDIGAGLPGVASSSVAWGDYDNDGDLDILLTGLTGSEEISRVYRNDGGNVFTDIGAGLIGVQRSFVAWGDYDKDGDLDLVLSGDTGAGFVTRVYRSDGVSANVPPATPTNLSAQVDGSTLTLSWDAATDAETPSAGLSYNLRVGTTPGGSEIVSAMADATGGYRRVVQLGNAQQRTSWTLTVAPGSYFWSVQAVDGAYAGSEFAPEEQTQVFGFTDLGAGLPGLTYSSVAWGDYDNDGDLDLVLSGYGGTATYVTAVYRNDGEGVFEDIEAGLTGDARGSVVWGDYDNDGDLDILLTGHTWTGTDWPPTTEVYRNDGGSFTDIDVGLADVTWSTGAWGDYDNDGDLDILLTGDTGSEVISRVYRNEAGSFADIGAGLPGVSYSSAAWGDYDNDGDLDILLTGQTPEPVQQISRVYRNDAGSFTDIGADLIGVDTGSVAWGDYDNDGDLDILLTGWTGSEEISSVYRNAAGSFTDIGAGLPGVSGGSVAWGDYDNDGDVDILLAGYEDPGTFVSEVYRNDGGNVFTATDAGLPGVYVCSAAWGDYDNDGDLDIVLTGNPGSSRISRVYRNDRPLANTPPAAVGNLSASLVADQLTLSWDAATDAETPSAGLSYNLRVGTTPGGSEIVSAMADEANGYRRVVQLGNAQQRTSWTVTVRPGSYFWSVQAVDGAYAGSEFAPEEQTEVFGFTDLVAALPGAYDGSVAWGDFDNDGDLDILLTGYTSSEQISRVYRNDGGDVFTDLVAGLPGVFDSSVAWGDYDNDGDLDILLTGYTGSEYISRVYRLDPGSFTDIGAGLPGVFYSSAAWGDYDNDGDLDILLTGTTGSEYISRVYRNDAGIFTDLGAGLPGVSSGSVAWGDYDNDGDLDILLTGNEIQGEISRVYRNDAGIFTDLGAGLPGVSSGSVAWGDYDNDGDLDILLTGETDSDVISRVYRNDAGIFTDLGAGLPGVGFSSVAWGDYDNDGDLDILLSGNTFVDKNSNRISSVYRNDAGIFTDLGAGLPGAGESSVAWGDYDNDGDLDILLTGYTGSASSISRVYWSNWPANTPPSPPENLTATTSGDGIVTFSWEAATDEETPSQGLTYNLRVGTTPGGDEILSAMADAGTGHRLVAAAGNVGHNLSWSLARPPLQEKYHWSVQAIDGAFEGSEFASEGMVGVLAFQVEGRATLSGIELTWDVRTTSNLQSLVILRGESDGPLAPREQFESAKATLRGRWLDTEAQLGTTYRYCVSVQTEGIWVDSEEIEVTAGGSEVPERTRLVAAVPNPFNPKTTLRFALAEAGNVRIRIFDVAGRQIRDLRLPGLPVGWHEAEWNGEDEAGRRVASGSYLVQLEASNRHDQIRILLLK